MYQSIILLPSSIISPILPQLQLRQRRNLELHVVLVLAAKAAIVFKYYYCYFLRLRKLIARTLKHMKISLSFKLNSLRQGMGCLCLLKARDVSVFLFCLTSERRAFSIQQFSILLAVCSIRSMALYSLSSNSGLIW